MALRRILSPLYWTLALVLLLAAMATAGYYAPADPSLGRVQKIFYLHLPVAMNTFLACAVVFLASIGYVWQRRLWWDQLAAAAAQVGVLFCSIVLITGSIWARDVWGGWWAWSPRLIFSLMLWILYVAYLVLRSSVRDPARRRLICAVYGIIAFLDVPLVYLSVKLLPDVHPSDVQLSAPMRQTLLLWFVPTTMVCAGLIRARFGRGNGASRPAETGLRAVTGIR